MAKKREDDIFQSLRKDVFSALEEASGIGVVKEIETEYLGKRGRLTNILKGLKDMPESERKTAGSTANALKKEIEERIRQKKNEFGAAAFDEISFGGKGSWMDISAPGRKTLKGHSHPLSRIILEVSAIFELMGFKIVDGPEMESEYYHFDALNIPKDHPARDMWNSFWVKDSAKLLRAHTSPNQIRYMEKNQPPFRIIVPGRCFRYEATDATHDVQFYQLEGLMMGAKINLANLKGTVEAFFQKLFRDKNLKARFRPSYFPFVEPGVEIDIKPSYKNEWIEIAGAGMVHPKVIKNAKLDPAKWQGFAFGFGLDRIAMMKYKIDDIRLFYSGDLRFINQF